MGIRGQCAVIIAAVVAAFGAGCGGTVGVEDTALGTDQDAVTSSDATSEHACNGDGQCTFAKGVETCVYVTQTTQVSTHAAISGCMAFDGTKFVPGRRTRTFEDVYLFTATTTVERHGHCGKIISTSTTTERQLQSSTQISDICEVI